MSDAQAMADAGGQESAGMSVEVRRGHPTDEELAALIAVIGEAYSAEAASALAEEAPTRSAWAVSARGLRAPLRRELGWARG